jgi:hypothetical protein
MNFSCTLAFSLQKTDHCANVVLGGNFFDVGVQKLVSRYDKCPSSEDDYVEK